MSRGRPTTTTLASRALYAGIAGATATLMWAVAEPATSARYSTTAGSGAWRARGDEGGDQDIRDILYRLGIRAGAVDMIAEYQPRLGVYFFYMYIAGFRGIITLTKDQFWELVELADKIIKDLIVLEGEINTE